MATSSVASNVKLELHKKCLEFVDQRYKHIIDAIASASESGNEEIKSSAGDKHETSRAMMHLEQENNAKQLQEVLELKKLVDKIDPNIQSTAVTLGSLIVSNRGNFYVSIGIGKMLFDNIIYYGISTSSPLAIALMGAKYMQKVNFNGNEYVVEAIL